MEKKRKTKLTIQGEMIVTTIQLNLFLECYLDHEVNNLIGCLLTFNMHLKGFNSAVASAAAGYTILN